MKLILKLRTKETASIQIVFDEKYIAQDHADTTHWYGIGGTPLICNWKVTLCL